MLHQVGVSFDLYYDARKHKSMRIFCVGGTLVGLLQSAERESHLRIGIAVCQMECRACITDMGYVHCEVQGMSDVTQVLRGEPHRNVVVTGMKNKNFEQSRGMRKEKTSLSF